MSIASTAATARFGRLAAVALALLALAYAVVLATGLLTLPSPDHAIQDPWFTVMEVLILAIAPTMVAFTAALHRSVPSERRALSACAVVFMAMCAVVTCTVHFAILALSGAPAFSEPGVARAVFAFRWPSVAYALDILAWDLFFAIGALFAGAALGGGGSAAARRLFVASGLLALVGLAGVPLADMRLRDVGIVGYVVLFPMAALLAGAGFGRGGGSGAD